MKKIIALITAFLMVASLAACGGKDSETTVYSENAVIDAFSQLFEQISKKGGYISLTTSEDLLSSLGAETNGVTIRGFDVIIDNNQAQLGIIGKYNKNDISDSLYLSDKALVLNAPKLLGGAYGIDFTTLSKDWDSSFLNPKNGSENAIPEDTIASFGQLIDVMSGNTNTVLPGQSAEKVTEVLTNFTEKLMKKIEKTLPISIKTEGNYTTKTLRITLDDIATLLNLAADTLQGDAEMKSIIDSILITSTDPDASSVTADQLITVLRSATDFFDMSAIADCEFNIILSYKCSKDNMDKTIMIGVEIIQAEESATLAFGIRDQMTNTKTEFTHTISTAVKSTGYFEQMLAEDADFAETLSNIEGFQYKTVWNKTSGVLQTKIKVMDQIASLDANLKFNTLKNGNLELVFVFEKLAIEGMFDSDDVIKAPITLKLSTEKPKALSAPKYSNILQDENAIEKIATHIQKEFGALVEE